MSRRRSARREPWPLRVLRVLGALAGWFLFTGLFTVLLMLAGIKR